MLISFSLLLTSVSCKIIAFSWNRWGTKFIGIHFCVLLRRINENGFLHHIPVFFRFPGGEKIMAIHFSTYCCMSYRNQLFKKHPFVYVLQNRWSLKLFHIHREMPVLKSFFIKKRLWHSCFPVSIAKFDGCLLILVALEDFHSVKVKVIYWFWTTSYNKGQKIHYWHASFFTTIHSTVSNYEYLSCNWQEGQIIIQ